MLKLHRNLEAVLARGGTVVVPSRQRALAVRLAYAAAQLAQGRQVWNTPDVLPLEGWLTREIERYAASSVHGEGAVAEAAADAAAGPARVPRLLSAAEEWLLWRQCTAGATGDLDLVNRVSLAESLRRASALAADLRIDLRAIRPSAGAEADLLASVDRAVAERCRALGCAPLPAALATLPCVGDERPVAFRGFIAPSPRLQSILQARARHGWEASWAAPTDALDSAPPQVVRPADERDELERIAGWCALRLTAQADARLLVLLPGAPGRRERLATLIRQAVDPRAVLQSAAGADTPSLVGLEGGQPLANVSLAAHALTSLALLAGASVEIERLLEWLRAPWWGEPGPAGRARLDLWLREQDLLRLDLPTLRRTLSRAPAALALPAQGLGSRLDEAAAAAGAGPASPREWSERLGAALAALGWPGARSRGSAEQQTLQRLHELLEELGQLSAAVRTMSLDTAVEWLTELASRTAYRPCDDDPAVTISPVYADPVAGYDGVWVAGLHADAFPQPVSPDPFLPLAAQTAAGWPAATAAGRLEEARALLAAWRAAADELVLSAPARAEDIELLPSPLIEEWRGTGQEPSAPGAAVWLPARLSRPGWLTEWRDDVGTAWSPQVPLPSGTRSLELQNQCPFRAYAELRLGSLDLGVPEPGIAPDARGRLLHAAQQYFWEQLGDSRALEQLSAPAREELLTAAIERAAAALAADEDPIARASLARECRRTARLMRRLLEIELQRAPFRVAHTEYEARLRLAGHDLRLRIDRLDALESGGVAILDYKSGKRTSADWYGDRPSHPQLLAYLAAVGEDVVALATVNMTAKEVRFDGIAASEALLPKVAAVKGAPGPSEEVWQARVREWRGLVERLAGAFAGGQAAVDPRPGACDFCHVAAVCRVGDGLAAPGDESSEGATGERIDE